MVYPTPQTVLMNLGFRLGSCIFSRSRAMWAMTVLLLSRYFSPHTASNSSSDGDHRAPVGTQVPEDVKLQGREGQLLGR